MISSSYSCTVGARPSSTERSPGPDTTTCSTEGRWGSSGASSGSSEPLARTTLSSAWLTIQTSCSAGSRRLRVCSTAPIEGIARYASTCSALFHMRVATRWSPSTPSSSRRACASCEARAPMSAKLRRCGSGSPVQVVTCDFPWMVIPWVRMRVTVSGTSCMVLSTASSRWALRGGKSALILLTYQAVCHYFREYESMSSGADRQKGARNGPRGRRRVRMREGSRTAPLTGPG